MSKVRCAIYTRKSSEEGLEQDFNSLHAQREACAAYVLSQASEGWTLLPEVYDDGGISGGTLERPALVRLLDDIASGRIDIVVVYKVDRLTRSLLDFAKLVEAFDKAGVSFVSVTQSFNTTTSMGRLTLNMLLSFAQFEREVTAERIRDKIAASKARGMWMGGVPPLGYTPDGRSLRIVPEHASVVHEIFERYLAICNVRRLVDALATEGIRVPARTALTGRAMGGGLFTRGQIYKLLSNPIYLGEIHHRGKAHDGKHDAIIDRDLWDAVQSRLTDNTQGNERGISIQSPSPLAGRVYDATGDPLVAAHASKTVTSATSRGSTSKRRYRYYVSRALQHGAGADAAEGIRIPALALERTIAVALAARFDDPLGLAASAGLEPRPEQIKMMSIAATRIASKLRKGDPLAQRALVAKVTVGPERIEVDLTTSAVASALGLEKAPPAPDTISMTIDARIRRSGMAIRLIHDNGRTFTQAGPQDHLIRLLTKARCWWRELTDNQISVSELAERNGVSRSYASRVVRLNFLAPAIVEAILAGDQPSRIDTRVMLGMYDLPLDWKRQAQVLQFS